MYTDYVSYDDHKTLDEAKEAAKRKAKRLACKVHVLSCSGDTPFFTVSDRIYKELYLDRKPLFTASN